MGWLEAQPLLWVVVPGVCVHDGRRKQTAPKLEISGKGVLEMPRAPLEQGVMLPVLLAQGSPNGVWGCISLTLLLVNPSRGCIEGWLSLASSKKTDPGDVSLLVGVGKSRGAEKLQR